MLFPFERPRRAILKIFSYFVQAKKKIYIQENLIEFNIVNLVIEKSIILDGLWQNEEYFHDILDILKKDLTFNLKLDQDIINLIKVKNSVALHVRWFETNENSNNTNNLAIIYYRNAIGRIKKYIRDPHFLIFSDDIDATKEALDISNETITYISKYTKNMPAVYDMYLMSMCENFIISNSTFSWWAAWLSSNKNKHILMPISQIKMFGSEAWDKVTGSWVRY